MQLKSGSLLNELIDNVQLTVNWGFPTGFSKLRFVLPLLLRDTTGLPVLSVHNATHSASPPVTSKLVHVSFWFVFGWIR